MKLLVVFAWVVAAITASACIWDAVTLEEERTRNVTMAEVILAKDTPASDPKPHLARIKQLTNSPRQDDPAWWNDLAGAYIRAGNAAEAVKILEPLLTTFPTNYGVHANLGTAYHLVGDYVKAEKHITIDLELNPDAHFGLEKYHLALLRYLTNSPESRIEHVYLTNWSKAFRDESPEDWDAYSGRPPQVDGRWDDTVFAPDPKADTNFNEGIIYMASLNPKEPGCFVMLGIACAVQRDFNLTIAAFEKAIALGSPQKELLQRKITLAKEFIDHSHRNRSPQAVRALGGTAFLIALIIGLVVAIAVIRTFLRRGSS